MAAALPSAYPFPLPRTARPGGYALEPTNQPSPASSLLEALFGSIEQDRTLRTIDRRTDALLADNPASALEPAVDTVTGKLNPLMQPEANPYVPRPGLLSALLGSDNPVAKWTGDNRHLLQGFGSALLSDGMDFSRVPMYAAMDDEQRQKAADWSKTEGSKRKLLQSLEGYGEAYSDIAEALAADAVDANTAMKMVFERRAQLKTKADADLKNKTNAQFLNTPELKAAVEAGAISFADAYKLEQGGGAAKFETGFTPIWGTYEGQPATVLPGNDGQFYINGKPIDPSKFIPTNPYDLNAQKSGGAAFGKATGGIQANMPVAQKELDQTNAAIGNLKTDPNVLNGMDDWFNQWGMFPRGVWVQGGSDMAQFRNAANNVIDRSWLSARDALKGGGQITDYEGVKAENAVSMMKAALDSGNKKQFEDARDDYEYWVQQGFAKLQQQASAMQGYSSGGAGGIPTVSDPAGYNALPSGSQYIAPDGTMRTKP